VGDAESELPSIIWWFRWARGGDHGVPGVTEHAAFASLEDARTVRRRVLERSRGPRSRANPAATVERRAALVVCGGPTGVEVAALHDLLAEELRRAFPELASGARRAGRGRPACSRADDLAEYAARTRREGSSSVDTPVRGARTPSSWSGETLACGLRSGRPAPAAAAGRALGVPSTSGGRSASKPRRVPERAACGRWRLRGGGSRPCRRPQVAQQEGRHCPRAGARAGRPTAAPVPLAARSACRLRRRRARWSICQVKRRPERVAVLAARLSDPLVSLSNKTKVLFDWITRLFGRDLARF
jgi:hypothetical protein